ncbi:MAG: hypothetical protein P9L99_19815 [Candidatus Lernaella stagnicola]|nr:hypothetical protein [Candidatus Lernaella stagnicola]
MAIDIRLEIRVKDGSGREISSPQTVRVAAGPAPSASRRYQGPYYGAATRSGSSAGGANTGANTREELAQALELQRRWKAEAVATRVVYRGLEASIGTIGDGIAGQLVDGTYDWERAWKRVMKQIIAASIKLAAMKAIFGGLSAGTSGGSGLLGILVGSFHRGGLVSNWPRHHSGVLSRNEHPAILQRGEFVVRREAAHSIGHGRLQEMNRTGQPPSAPIMNVTLHYQGAGKRHDARQLANMLEEEMWSRFQRRYRRGFRWD